MNVVSITRRFFNFVVNSHVCECCFVTPCMRNVLGELYAHLCINQINDHVKLLKLLLDGKLAAFLLGNILIWVQALLRNKDLMDFFRIEALIKNELAHIVWTIEHCTLKQFCIIYRYVSKHQCNRQKKEMEKVHLSTFLKAPVLVKYVGIISVG